MKYRAENTNVGRSEQMGTCFYSENLTEENNPAQDLPPCKILLWEDN